MQSIVFKHADELPLPSAASVVRAVARLFEAEFDLTEPSADHCIMLWCGLCSARRVLHSFEHIDDELLEDGVIPIFRPCAEHWGALRTLGDYSENTHPIAHHLDGRPEVANLLNVVVTRVDGIPAALAELMPALAPELVETAASTLAADFALLQPRARPRVSAAEMEYELLVARTASLRAVRVVVKELPKPISTALCADPAALAALGLCVRALPRWARDGSADLPKASELLGIVQALACVRGGPSRLVSMGAVPALAPSLEEELFDRLICVPLSENRLDVRPDVRGHAASVLLLLASAEGSAGREARAQLHAAQVPLLAARMITLPAPQGKRGTPFDPEQAPRADLALRLVSDVKGLAAGLEGDGGQGAAGGGRQGGAAAAARRYELADALTAAASHPGLGAGPRATLLEALACMRLLPSGTTEDEGGLDYLPSCQIA
jgi:hypothetical protein